MAAFEKITQGVGLYDHWIDVQGAPFIEAEQWAQHAVQSVVWNMAGMSYDRLLLNFSDKRFRMQSARAD